MKKLTKYQLTKVSKNLDKYFNLATDQNINDGLNWYQTAHDICIDIAQKYNTTTFIAAGVISALSPRNKWRTNIKDTYTVFDAISNGLEAKDVKVSTFHKNKFKAFAIAKGMVTITKDSQKTYSFCENIAHLNDKFITVDVWHARACFDKNTGAVKGLAYEQIRDLTLRKAAKLGIKGFEYQAIVWGSVQDNF